MVAFYLLPFLLKTLTHKSVVMAAWLHKTKAFSQIQSDVAGAVKLMNSAASRVD